jgi:S1-C subfamily serine protease
MTESGTRVVIRHLSGSKVNQIEQFDVANLQEITLGRDPTSTVVYDRQRDDAVSRKHAVIRVHNDEQMYFRIADLGSSNGTLLNGERIGGEVELLPEDVVELGSGGPRFSFDVAPRPAYLPSRSKALGGTDADATRMITIADAGATRVVPVAEAGATAERGVPADTQQRTSSVTTSSALTRAPVGKATIMRMMSDERRSSRQVWIAALAAVLVLAIIGGGGLYWHSQSVASQLRQEVAAQAARADAISAQASDALARSKDALSPEDIHRYGEATVYVRDQWQLFDTDTNRQIYQKMVKVDGEWLPAYVRLEDGRLWRWLTLENDKDSFYKPIGTEHSGSGFVIGSEGFILTNKHVAARWSSEYSDFEIYGWTRGSVYAVRSDRHDVERNVNRVEALNTWVPENGGYLFESTRPNPISNGIREFYGRNEVLTVQFPGTRFNINATLLRTSLDADVAELKIDSTQSLSKLDLELDDKSVKIGQKIILLGYPGVSQKTQALQVSNEGGTIRERVIDIPEPTVTEGIIAKMPTNRRKDRDDVTTFGSVGDMYQLDIFAAPGHSGGPVLNAKGNVIGLLSAKSTSAEHVSFAVPVSYVRELLQPQRNASP